MQEYDYFILMEEILINRDISNVYSILEYLHKKVDEEKKLGYTFESIGSRLGHPNDYADTLIADFELSGNTVMLNEIEEIDTSDVSDIKVDKPCSTPDTLNSEFSEKKEAKSDDKFNMDIPDVGFKSPKAIHIGFSTKVLIFMISCILVFLSIFSYLFASVLVLLSLALTSFSFLDSSILPFAIFIAILLFSAVCIIASFISGINHNMRTKYLKLDRKMKKLWYVVISFVLLFGVGMSFSLYVPYIINRTVINNTDEIMNLLEASAPTYYQEIVNLGIGPYNITQEDLRPYQDDINALAKQGLNYAVENYGQEFLINKFKSGLNNE